MKPTTASVIILNYNGREHLEVCLSSLLELDFPKAELEVIVVDNGSTDGSAEMIASNFSHVRLLRSETNLGFSKGANLGAANASGHYLAFLNNDMRVDRQWLKMLVEFARSDQSLACVGSAILNWDGTEIDFAGRPDDAFCLDDAASNASRKPASLPATAEYLLFVSAGAALVRAEAFRESGGFDPDYFLYHEDVDLCWRFWLRGHKCAMSPSSIAYHRGGASAKKLSPDYVQRLAQKHILFTLFKNLEAENLEVLLPLVFYHLLERGLRLGAAQASIAAAAAEFQLALDDLARKRAEVQRLRVRSDEEIFSAVGHPVGFLLRQERYLTIRNEVAAQCSLVTVDSSPGADKAHIAISELMQAAHFLFERDTIITLQHLCSQLGAEEEQVRALSAELSSTAASLSSVSSQLTARETQLAVQGDRIQERSSQISVQEAKFQELSAELGKIKGSLGWRLLSRYGRVKYRYLLPVYRWLRLGARD